MNQQMQALLDQLIIAFRQPASNPRMATLLFGSVGLLLALFFVLLFFALMPRQRKVVKRITYFVPGDQTVEGGDTQAQQPDQESIQDDSSKSSESVPETSAAQEAEGDETLSVKESWGAEDSAEPGDGPTPEDVVVTQAPRWRRTMRWALGTGLPFVLVIAALIFTYVYTGTDGYCVDSCHGGDEFVRQAAQRDHARCVACHEDPSAVGVVGNVSDRARMVWHRLQGTRTPTLARDAKARMGTDSIVDADACLTCHGDVLDKTITVKAADVRVSHKEPIAAGQQCADCHEISGHEEGDTRFVMSMRRCILCHDDKKAPAACETCHLGDITLAGREKRILEQAEAVRGSGKHQYPAVDARLEDCGGCHGAQKECDACHGLRMPHSPRFLEGYHAKDAAFEKKELCWRCHVPNDCETGGCHLSFIYNTHYEGFKEDHSKHGWDSGCGCHMRTRNIDVPICVFCHDNAPVKRIEVPDAARGILGENQ